MTIFSVVQLLVLFLAALATGALKQHATREVKMQQRSFTRALGDLIEEYEKVALVTLVATAIMGGSALASAAETQEVERGKYLVTITSCNDCHTPGWVARSC